MGKDNILFACEDWFVNHHSRNWIKKALNSMILVREIPELLLSLPCFNFNPRMCKTGEWVSDLPYTNNFKIN